MAASESQSDEVGVEVSLVVQDDGLLVAGEPVAVDRFVAQFRQFGRSVGNPELTAQNLTDVASAASALAALGATSGTYFSMSPESLKLYQSSKVMPGSGGYFRGVFIGRPGITNLAQFHEVSVVAEQALSIQMMMATAALRVAMREVQQAVEHVEGKVDDLVVLTKARTIAGVVGEHRLLAEYVDRMDRTGALPDVDWDTVAGLGPGLAVGIEELRRYVRGHVERLPQTQGAQKRSEGLHELLDVVRIGEVLQLLVIAEDSHYLWQRLRVERSRTSDPAHVGEINESARRLLREDLEADSDLVLGLQEWLVEYGKLRPLEIYRVLSRNALEADVPRLRQAVDEFVEARRLQIVSWTDLERPTLEDARAEVRRHATEAREKVRELQLPQKALDGVRGLGDMTAEHSRKALQAVRGRRGQRGESQGES
jgi:hypothetical protein